MHNLQIENMTWAEIKSAIENGYKTIIIAVGSIEQHGKHLPIKTDSLIGEELAKRVTKLLDSALQGPTIRFGYSEHHLGFPGTISLEIETFKAVIRDYVRSVSRHGFTKIIFLPSHGGNFKPLEEVITELQPQYPELEIYAYTDLEGFLAILNDCSMEEGISAEEAGAHSGENETSMVMAINRRLVREDQLEAGYVGSFGPRESELILTKGIKALTENGVLGDPRRASKKNGAKYLGKVSAFLVEKIRNSLNKNQEN